MSALPKPPPSSAVETVDTRFLETLMGYNARRASLAIVDVFMVRMAPYALRIVDFSVLSLVGRNPGITSRQLCSTLGVLPPNWSPSSVHWKNASWLNATRTPATAAPTACT